MSLRRGTVYEYPGQNVSKVLVLTSDDWNDHMLTVGVIPVRASAAPPLPHTVLIHVPEEMHARGGQLASVDKERLGRAVFLVDEEEMVQVGQAVRDLLACGSLSAQPPRRPPAPTGLANYPVWGNIYYVGEPLSGERKRFVVVSNDDWNRNTGSAVVVRTTTSQNRGGPGFPAIQRGAARAVCGEATTFGVRRFRMRPDSRPSPQRLVLQDMVAIASGIVDTHQL